MAQTSAELPCNLTSALPGDKVGDGDGDGDGGGDGDGDGAGNGDGDGW